MLLDAFLKLEAPPLEGESTDKEHAKEIEILSFDQTIIRQPKSAGTTQGNAGKVKSEHKPLTIIKPVDKSSPKLYQAASAGTVYKKAVISLCQPSGTTETTSSKWKKIVYLEVTLEGVHIVRAHLVGDPRLHAFGRSTSFPITAGEVLAMGPLEEIDLAYAKIEWMYKGGSGTANITGKWNLATNSAT